MGPARAYVTYLLTYVTLAPAPRSLLMGSHAFETPTASSWDPLQSSNQCSLFESECTCITNARQCCLFCCPCCGDESLQPTSSDVSQQAVLSVLLSTGSCFSAPDASLWCRLVQCAPSSATSAEQWTLQKMHSCTFPRLLQMQMTVWVCSLTEVLRHIDKLASSTATHTAGYVQWPRYSNAKVNIDFMDYSRPNKAQLYDCTPAQHPTFRALVTRDRCKVAISTYIRSLLAARVPLSRASYKWSTSCS